MTIEITDEMVRETIKRAVQKWNESVGPDEPTLTPSDIFSEDVRDHLTAALPIIEKAVRDEQAKAIDTFAEVFRVDAKEHFGRIGASSETYLNALIDAARIVREGDHNDN